MTVDELVEFFTGEKSTGSSERVYVAGYEGGLEDLEKEQIEFCRIKRDENGKSDIFGPHEEAYNKTDVFDEYDWVLKRRDT